MLYWARSCPCLSNKRLNCWGGRKSHFFLPHTFADQLYVLKTSAWRGVQDPAMERFKWFVSFFCIKYSWSENGHSASFLTRYIYLNFYNISNHWRYCCICTRTFCSHIHKAIVRATYIITHSISIQIVMHVIIVKIKIQPIISKKKRSYICLIFWILLTKRLKRIWKTETTKLVMYFYILA